MDPRWSFSDAHRQGHPDHVPVTHGGAADELSSAEVCSEENGRDLGGEVGSCLMALETLAGDALVQHALRVGNHMIISRTPLRISFAGGGTDIPEYYRNNGGGAVVNAAIDKYVHIVVNKKFDDQVRVSYSQTEIVPSAEDVRHPLVREALKLLDIRKGIEIVSISDIPSHGTGLGSSSTFTVGLLNALHAWTGEHAPAKQLAEEAVQIERDIVRDPGGKQDQYIAAYGGLRFVEFHPDERVSVTPIIMRCSSSTRSI